MDVKLVMFKADGSRKDFPILGSVTLGRAEDADLRIPLPNVSRHHTQVVVAGDQLKVRDMGSSNGTFVNNKRVQEAPLKAGDRMVIGPVVFTVQIDGQPEEIKPVKMRMEPLVPAMADESGDEVVELDASDEGGEVDVISALEALAKKDNPAPRKK